MKELNIVEQKQEEWYQRSREYSTRDSFYETIRSVQSELDAIEPHFTALLNERDTLKADNKRLREALENCRDNIRNLLSYGYGHAPKKGGV